MKKLVIASTRGSAGKTSVIIGMGKALGMTIVAEGVETDDQQTFLRDHACDEMQGYLFSKPLPPQEMADLLRSQPRLDSPPLQPEGYGETGAIAGRLEDGGLAGS